MNRTFVVPIVIGLLAISLVAESETLLPTVRLGQTSSLTESQKQWREAATIWIWEDCLSNDTCNDRTPQSIANSLVNGIEHYEILHFPNIDRVHVDHAINLLGPIGWPIPENLDPFPDYVRWCESRNDYTVVNSIGAGGAYQFLPSTWQSYGGLGLPQHAAPLWQDYIAAIVWDNGNGASHWKECL